jgi:hypothetical protein
MTSVPSHVTPLRLSQRAAIALVPGCAPQALVDGAWLGVPVTPGETAGRVEDAGVATPAPSTRRFLTDLSLPVRDRSPRLTFRKAAYVDLGEVRETPDGCEVDISWQSSSLAPLFPVFAGRIKLTRTEIALEGYYAPPGGEVGAVLDRAFLNIAARGTARWFLEQIAASLAADEPCRQDRAVRSAASGHTAGA